MRAKGHLALLCLTACAGLWTISALAAGVGLNTPCSIVHGTFMANDRLAYDEATQAARAWLLSNDRSHIFRSEEQVRFFTMQGVGLCGGPSGFDGTLRKAMSTIYNRYEPMVSQEQAMERDSADQRRKAAQAYHERVLKNLNQ